MTRPAGLRLQDAETRRNGRRTVLERFHLVSRPFPSDPRGTRARRHSVILAHKNY